MSESKKIAIIGAGWAGLTIAYLIAKHNLAHDNNSNSKIYIDIFEASSFYGGRARSFKYNNYLLDNGQHILIGAYNYTLKLMQELGINFNQSFNIYPIQWHCYKSLSIPPIKNLFNILSAKNLGFKLAIKLIYLLYKI